MLSRFSHFYPFPTILPIAVISIHFQSLKAITSISRYFSHLYIVTKATKMKERNTKKPKVSLPTLAVENLTPLQHQSQPPAAAKSIPGSSKIKPRRHQSQHPVAL